MTNNDKGTSLIHHGIYYSHKMFYSTGPMLEFYLELPKLLFVFVNSFL